MQIFALHACKCVANAGEVNSGGNKDRCHQTLLKDGHKRKKTEYEILLAYDYLDCLRP